MREVGLIIVLLVFTVLQINAQEKPKPNKNGVICNSNAIYLPKPEFSKEAIKNVARNSIYVKILIDEKGDVKSAEAFSESPLLNLEAEEAALKAKFRITRRSGIPVKVHCNIVYNFEQNKNTQDDKESLTIGHAPSNTKPIFEPEIKYPEAARINNIAGKVTICILVDEKGNVEKAEIVSGHPLLRIEALRAAKLTKFKPITFSDGRPVKFYSTLIYDFVP